MKTAMINSDPTVHNPAEPAFSIVDDKGVEIGRALYAEEKIPCPCGCGGQGASLEAELAGAFRVARRIMRDGVELHADGVARIMLTVMRSRNVVLAVAPTATDPKH